MTKLYETKENFKTEYKRLKKKRVKALPIWLLIIAIILGWYFYVQDVSASQKGLETQLDKLERSIEQRFQDVEESNEKRDKEQDDKIDNVKSAKAKEKERTALLESSRPKPVQRVGSTVGREDVVAYINAKFGVNAPRAIAIATCESGLNPNAVNWGDARITGMPSNGVFQINSHQNWNWNDYKANTDRAYDMFVRRGWQPWTCAKKV